VGAGVQMSAGSKTALSLGTLELGMILPSSAAGFPSKDDMSFRRAAVVVVGSQLELWTCDGGVRISEVHAVEQLQTDMPTE
jgi:hypothetical protein